MFLFCLVFAMFCVRLFICALWSSAGKGLTSWLSFVVSSVSLSLSHWYPGSGVVLDCIDSWSLQPYYFNSHITKHHVRCTLVIRLSTDKTTSDQDIRWMHFQAFTCHKYETWTSPFLSDINNGWWYTYCPASQEWQWRQVLFTKL